MEASDGHLRSQVKDVEIHRHPADKEWKAMQSRQNGNGRRVHRRPRRRHLLCPRRRGTCANHVLKSRQMAWRASRRTVRATPAR